MIALKKLALTGAAIAALGACSANDGDKTSAPAETTETAVAPATDTGRVRGVLQSMTDDALTVTTYDGQTVTVPIDGDTGYAWVLASSLSTLKDGDFIGTATTGLDDALRAVELVIFPEAMRGTGEGHYDWDVPGVVAANGGGAAESSAMTNGTVQQSAMTNGTVQGQSAMTNGTVTGGADASGEKTLTISYKGGTSQVLVPEGIPIVRFDPADKAILAKGQKVFVVTPSGATAAKFVAVGKDGLTPPM